MDIIEISANEEEIQTVIPIVGDGACLFRALSFLMFNNQEEALKVRRNIVKYVRANWDEFSLLTYHPAGGDNYKSPKAYQREMNRPGTYGGLCELKAAGELYPYIFEVYQDGKLYLRAGFEGNPRRRLKFTGDLSSGHFDAYLPISDK